MKEVIYDYNFDLERVIKQSKKKSKFKRGIEKSIEAKYILDNFIKNNLGKKEDVQKENVQEKTNVEETMLEITEKDLQKATIKTTEKTNTQITKTDGTKITRKKVVKYYVMSKKEKFQIIRQITEYMCINKDKTMNRTTSYLEQADLIEEGILYDSGELNMSHPLVKKLIPKKKKMKVSGDIEH